MYRIQTSLDLEVWTDMQTVTNQTGTVQVTDPVGTNRTKFYRAVLAR